MGCNLFRLSLISFHVLPVRCLKTPIPRQPACHYLSLGAVPGRQGDGASRLQELSQRVTHQLHHTAASRPFVMSKVVLGPRTGPLFPEGLHRKSPGWGLWEKPERVHSPANKFLGQLEHQLSLLLVELNHLCLRRKGINYFLVNTVGLGVSEQLSQGHTLGSHPAGTDLGTVAQEAAFCGQIWHSFLVGPVSTHPLSMHDHWVTITPPSLP